MFNIKIINTQFENYQKYLLGNDFVDKVNAIPYGSRKLGETDVEDLDFVPLIFHDMWNEKDIVFTCGSGVTACVLGLANSIISGKTPIIYDGSWSEWGKE